MKAIKILTLLTFLILLINCGTKEKKVTLIHEHVALPTIQCGMCKSAIESNLSKLNGVKSIHVDIEGKVGHVEYDKLILKTSDIEKAISDLGYQANDLAGDPEAYAKLPGCCKIPE